MATPSPLLSSHLVFPCLSSNLTQVAIQHCNWAAFGLSQMKLELQYQSCSCQPFSNHKHFHRCGLKTCHQLTVWVSAQILCHRGEPWGCAEGVRQRTWGVIFTKVGKANWFFIPQPLRFSVVFITAVFFLYGLLRGSRDCDSFKSATYKFFSSLTSNGCISRTGKWTPPLSCNRRLYLREDYPHRPEVLPASRHW